MNEKIICAAVWYKKIEVKKFIPVNILPVNCETGLVFCGHRHAQCIYTKCSITGLRDCESGENEQGFLTSKNRFVDREEGAKIFTDCGGTLKYSESKLYSEDIY